MQQYHTLNHCVVTSVEIGSAHGGAYAFLYGRDSVALRRFAQQMQQHCEHGAVQVMPPTQQGAPIMLRSEQSVDDVRQFLQSAIALQMLPDQAAPPRQPIDLMRLRGYLGFAGQAALMGAGYISGNHHKKWAGATSLATNVINITYGVQKKDDEQGLARAKEAINTVVPQAPSLAVAAAYHASPHSPFQQFMQANATRISDGMKLVAKGLFAWSGVAGGSLNDLRHGQLSMAAKVVTLLGKDEDPAAPSSNLIGRLREQSNPISASMEFIASVPLLMAGMNLQNPTAEKMTKLGASRAQLVRAGKWQTAGAALVLAGLTAKAFAPFTVKNINKQALYDYATAALMAVPEEQRAEKAMQMALEIGKNLQPEPELTEPKSAQTPLYVGEIYEQLMQQLPLSQVLTTHSQHALLRSNDNVMAKIA